MWGVFSITTSAVITRHTSNSSSLEIQAYPAITALFTAQPLLVNLCFDFWPECRTTSFSYLKLRLFGRYGPRTESTCRPWCPPPLTEPLDLPVNIRPSIPMSLSLPFWSVFFSHQERPYQLSTQSYFSGKISWTNVWPINYKLGFCRKFRLLVTD